MLIDFPNFEDYLVEHDRESILQKGTKFYHEGLIKHIHAFSGTEWDIYVESERPNIPGYTIRVRISNNKVTQVTCNCQGFRYSQLCKHIVASLFVLREKKLYDESIGDYAYDESEEEDEKEKVKEAPAKGKKGEKIEEEEQTPAKKKVQTKVNKAPEKSPQEKLATLEKEFECQVCSKPFENPVTLPCNSHSACLKCAEVILEDSKGKTLELKCPSCGNKGGSITIKDAKELKPNRELERIKHAFEKEKDDWLKEKSQLEKELEDLKGGKKDSGKMTEEYKLNKEIHPLDEKTKEAAEDAFFKLKNEGHDADEFLKQVDKNKENEEAPESPDVKKGGRRSSERKGKGAKGNGKTPEKGASKSNTSSAKRNHEKQSGGKENAEESAEKYGLRNKKVKSYAE